MKQYEYIFETKNELIARIFDSETLKSSTNILPKCNYTPPLYIPSKEGEYSSHIKQNIKLREMKFEDPYKQRDFLKQYDGSDFVIHGNTNIPQHFIRTNYNNTLDSNHEMRTWFIDIETRTFAGTALTISGSEEISLIQIYDTFEKAFYVFGTKDYNNNYESVFGRVEYRQFSDEIELLTDFINLTRTLDPTIIVGFNTYMFDFPYIVNRLKRLNMKPERLSPIGCISEREVTTKDNITYMQQDIQGRILLDYRELYQKYTFEKLARYNLETVANHELGEGKIQHDEYDSFEEFYLKDYQKFVDYSIRDVEVLIMLDNKLRLINTAKYIAYLCGCNIPDVMGTYKQWHSFMYNEAMKHGQILPVKQQYRNESDVFPGGWIGSVSGKYKWVVSFDFASLYPSIIRLLNLGLDSLIKPEDLPQELKELKQKYFSWYDQKNFEKLKTDNCHPDEHKNMMFLLENKEEINRVLRKYNVCASPNGYFYSKDKESVFGGLMRRIYNERVDAKNEAKKFDNMYSETKNEEFKLLGETNDLLQYVLKILLNSVYGSLSMEINAFSHGKGFSAAVTTGGRFANRLANHYMSNRLAELTKSDNKNQYKYTVNNHTDSGYINISEIVEKKINTMNNPSMEEKLNVVNNVCDKILQPCIDKAIEDLNYLLNVYDEKVLDMEKETLSDGFVVTTNGKYYCRYYKKDKKTGVLEPKHKIVGIAIIGKSTPPFCKEKLKPVLDIILDKDSNELLTYIDSVKKDFIKADIKDISPIKGTSSIDYPLPGYKKYTGEKYLTAPIHSRGSIIHNKIVKERGLKYELIRDGDKVYHTYLKTPNKEALNENVISYLNPKFMTESGAIKHVDYDIMFEKLFLKNIQLITDPIGWSLNPMQGLIDEWE